MDAMCLLLVDSLVQGLLFSFPALGLLIGLRYAGFPDLTVEGSFAVGAAVAMMGAKEGFVVGGLLMAAVCGAVAGTVTGLIFVAAKTGKLISAIIGMILAQSTALLVMGSTVSIAKEESLFASVAKLDRTLTESLRPSSPLVLEIATLAVLAVLNMVVLLGLRSFFSTRLGLALRSLGTRPELLSQLGLPTGALFVFSLSVGNLLGGVGGALFAHHQRGFDASLGFGTVIVGLIAIILGEELSRRTMGKKDLRPGEHLFSSVVGASLYMVSVFLIAEIFLGLGVGEQSPNLRRFITALFLASALLLRRGGELQVEEV